MEAQTIAQSLLELHQTGQLRVAAKMQDGPLEEAVWTIELDRILDAPATPPELKPELAIWATQTLIHGARLLLFREESFTPTPPSPAPPTPATAWSTDLAFRFLPSLHRRAWAVSENDPLTQHLAGLQDDWTLHAFAHDPFIARLIADREPSPPPSPSLPVDERPWLIPL